MNQVQTNLIFFSNIQYIPITEKLTESRINKLQVELTLLAHGAEANILTPWKELSSRVQLCTAYFCIGGI